MRADMVSNTDFRGKINIDKKMSKPMQDYVNRVLDYKIDGKSAREIISKKSYDVGISNMSSKKAIHPRLLLLTSFKVTSFREGSEDVYYRHKIRTNYPVLVGAKEVLRYLNWVDKAKENKNGYNNFWEKLVVLYKKVLK